MAISQINKSLDGSKSKEIENLLVQVIRLIFSDLSNKGGQFLR